MGLGKTLQTIGIVHTMLHQGHLGAPCAKNAVVICPTSLVLNWKAEVAKWLGDGTLMPTAITSDMKNDTITQQLSQFAKLVRRKEKLLILSYETAVGNIAELRKRRAKPGPRTRAYLRPRPSPSAARRARRTLALGPRPSALTIP